MSQPDRDCERICESEAQDPEQCKEDECEIHL